MKSVAPALLFSLGVLFAGPLPARAEFPWPVVAVAGATAADGITSVGGRELNPLYGQNRLTARRFALVNVPIVSAYSAGWKWSEGRQRKWIAIIGYAVAGLRLGVAIRNARVANTPGAAPR